MQRRTLLKLGAVSAAVLAVAGGAALMVEPGLRQGHLSEAARKMMSCVAGAMLEGTLPAQPQARQAALQGLLTRLDGMVQGFAPHVQAELSQMFSLLSVGPGRRLLAGLASDWQGASIPDVQEALQSMRLSRLAPRQQIYNALHELVGAAYFSDSSTWAKMGYPGPIQI